MTKSELSYIIKNEMVNDVEDLLLRRLRIAFLCSRDQTLSLVPELSKMLLDEKKIKLS